MVELNAAIIEVTKNSKATTEEKREKFAKCAGSSRKLRGEQKVVPTWGEPISVWNPLVPHQNRPGHLRLNRSMMVADLHFLVR